MPGAPSSVLVPTGQVPGITLRVGFWTLRLVEYQLTGETYALKAELQRFELARSILHRSCGHS